MWPVRSTAPAYEYLARKTKSSEPSFRPAAMVRLGTRHPGRDRKACGKQASAGNRLRGPTRHDPGLAPEAERIKVGCAGIGNSKPLGMVAPPRLWWLEIVAEMITFGLRNIQEQALSWKAGALLGERMRNGPASKCVASGGASS